MDGIGDALGVVQISPAQALRLLALAEILQSGDIDIRGDDADDVASAKSAIADVAQEIALQVHE